MKKKQILTSGITLINKKFKKNEYYHYFKEPNNVIIVPIHKKKFILVKQKRIPINNKNFEFPMGWIDKNENSTTAAKRELLEETGYKALKNPKKIVEFFADPGRGSRSCICYYSNKLKKIQTPEKKIKVFLFNKKQVQKLIKAKKFNNSAHIAAFYFYLSSF